MIAPSENIALLLFLRSEAQEALVKPLSRGGRRVNKAIFQKLNQHARRQARRSGLPLIVVQGPQQSGGTFGERLANAFEHAFSQGYERVIAIGNDCLALDAGRLQEAAIQLHRSDVVLGPARDGGVYLLGLSRQAFDRPFFLGLPWQTSRLYIALRQYALTWAGNPALLQEEEDADDAIIFRRLIGLLPLYGRLRRELKQLLSSELEMSCQSKILSSGGFHYAFQNRGPPTSSF